MRADLTGRRFGALVGIHSTKVFWICKCDCGAVAEVESNNLRSGNTISCGHLKGKRVRPSGKTCFDSMWARCTQPSNPRFESYAGRGIKICGRWKSYDAFIEDMGPRPSPAHSIERLDNDKDYSPENCIWGTPIQQGRNKRNNVRLDLNGESRTLSEWSELTGLAASCIHRRLKRGWTLVKALGEPARVTLRSVAA